MRRFSRSRITGSSAIFSRSFPSSLPRWNDGCGRNESTMSTYQAPLAEIQFVMTELAGLDQVAALPGFEEATRDVTAAILEEAAKFATNVLSPLNAVGDREGAKRLDDGT